MPAPMSDAGLDGLSKEVVDWYIRWNPSFATHAGIHEYDHLMPRATYEAELEERSHVKGFLNRLEGIDRKTLSPSRRVDHGVLRNSFRLWLFESEELGIWQAMPKVVVSRTLERVDTPEQIDSWNRTWSFFERTLRK